jgi:CheY-like chemotaxis protein
VTHPPSSSKTHRVLLVEDNAEDETLALRALNRAGATLAVTVARDGLEANEKLRSATFDLVLLDLNLPHLHGLEVLRNLRSDPQTAELPVVVLTTSNEESDVRTSYQAGANSFVRKPIDARQYNEAILQIVRYWLVLNERRP